MIKVWISSIKLCKEENNYGLSIGRRLKGELNNLSKIVILTGGNGCGKSRFLKLLKEDFEKYKSGIYDTITAFKMSEEDTTSNKTIECDLTKDIADSFNIINYSHFDAKLQSSANFSPYVIHQAKNKLKQCNYEETALNSLLYLKDLSQGYSEESNEKNDYLGLREFIELAKELELEFVWNADNKELTVFNKKLDEAQLSPGQLYALRIAVACKSHKPSDNYAFLLDEPETHLHPSLLIKIINKLMARFEHAQFFIATHSLSLISYLTVIQKDTTVLYMEKGEVKDRLRSDSEPILNNLIGTDDEQFAVKQLYVSTEELACNKFCMECFLEPAVVKGGVKGDPSVGIAEGNLAISGSSGPVRIVDYGAGKGRLIECMLEDDIISGYEYNAFNIDPEDYECCKDIISTKQINGKSYLSTEELAELNGTVDVVYMVNVLHEIDPDDWKNVFCIIHKLLKDNGKLVIIEREILTMGETPFTKGYLMLTGNEDKSNVGELLFGSDNMNFSRHKEKPYIIAYEVDKTGVDNVKNARMTDVFTELKNNALKQINQLKGDKTGITDHKDRYKHGIKLAFWLNQLSCATLYNEARNQEN